MIMKSKKTLTRIIIVVGIAMMAVACSSTYYGALEKFGIEKRAILA